MKKQIYLLAISLILLLASGFTTYKSLSPSEDIVSPSDRPEGLDQLYATISKTVQEGDFEGYAVLYHQDAVVVFTSNPAQGNRSASISKVLESWKQGFSDTKAGKIRADVEFRFEQRISDETTAHDTGIFHYSEKFPNGDTKTDAYASFEMLLVKIDNEWKILMEYQKASLSKKEWDGLK